MTQPPLLVRDCDESQLLELIFPLLTTNDYVLLGPGDDCAVIAAPNSQFVVSTDILIENQHFRREWSSAKDVGWRAAMQNLADIAAMGAVPTSVVLALGLPGELPTTWLQDFYCGFTKACQTVGAAVVGGDLSASAFITVAVTVHGDIQGLNPVLRSGAQDGDLIVHSGNLGWSAAGLGALNAGVKTGCGDRAVEHAIDLFLRPQPPLTCGPAIARAGATSLMDVSDGLLRDAARIARASQVTLALDLRELAADNDLKKVAEQIVKIDPGIGDSGSELAGTWQLSGGEDHGLLATLPLGASVPEGFTVIGHVKDRQEGQPLVTLDGRDVAGLAQGWDHFR